MTTFCRQKTRTQTVTTLQTRLQRLEAQERRQLQRKLTQAVQDLLTKLDALAQLDDVLPAEDAAGEDSRQGRANT